MFIAKNKTDLMIEVWEELDCESVGAKEIIAIENAVREKFGARAVDSPMVIARLLADEGAELRHSEIMQLYVARETERQREPTYSSIFDAAGLDRLLLSLQKAEKIRQTLDTKNDIDAIRRLRRAAIKAKETAVKKSGEERLSDEVRNEQEEAARWLTIWLQSPELFENWVQLRLRSDEFQSSLVMRQR